MVEWKELGDVCDIIRGKRVTKCELVENGAYPVISGGVTPMGYLNSYNRAPETITVSQYGTAGYVDFQLSPFWANDICYCLYPKPNLKNKYLLYCLKERQDFIYSIRNTDAVPYSLPSDSLKKVQIPIPSHAEQERIVGILDTFTDSIENLKQQIEQRRKQYEYYRDQLLFSNDLNAIVSDVSSLANGRISAEDLNADNYVSVENLLKDKAGKTASSVVPTEGKWLLYKENDILIGNIRPYLRKIWFSDICGGTNGDVLVIRPNEKVIPHFLYFVLSSETFFNYYNQTAKGGKMPRGEKKRALQFDFYLPSIVEQSRIVAILDQFEASIANMEQQLAQRQKQYEYYRNKLLTFE